MASGYLARRNQLAQQAGFRNYYEQRKFRQQAVKQLGAPTGNTKKAAAARDRLGKMAKEFAESGGKRADLEEEFGELFDEYDIEFDFDSDAWYDFLDENSPGNTE